MTGLTKYIKGQKPTRTFAFIASHQASTTAKYFCFLMDTYLQSLICMQCRFIKIRLVQVHDSFSPLLKWCFKKYHEQQYIGLTYGEIILLLRGHGCSIVVEHTARNLEAMGLNPAVSSFDIFSLSLPTFLHQWIVFNQVPQGGASLTVCCGSNKKWMPHCAAWGKNRLSKLRLSKKNI